MNPLFVKYKNLSQELKASIWFLVCAFFQRGISFITTPIFTRIMTAAEYGDFNVFYSWYGIIAIFVSLNLFYGVYVRGLVSYEDQRDRFTSSMEALMLTIISVWFVIYLFFKSFFNALFGLSTLQMLSMFILIWTNGVFNFWAAEQRVDLKYQRLVILTITSSIISPVVQIVLMLGLDDKVVARILGLLIVNCLFYPILFAGHMKKGKTFYDKIFWKYAVMFNIPLIPHYLSQTILNSADRIMIKDMIGADEAGIYSLAYSISQIMTIFNTALMQTIEPWLYKKIKNNQVQSIKKVAYPAFVAISLINLMLIAMAPEIVSFFAPGEYMNAIWIIPPVAMSVFFMFVYTFFAAFEFYYKKTQYITIATVIGAVINIVLNYCCINKWGYYAAGYTTLVCYILYALFHYLFMNKLIRDNLDGERVYDTRVMLSIIIIFMIAGFLLLLTYDKPLLRYLLVFVVIVTVFVCKNKIIKIVKQILSERK